MNVSHLSERMLCYGAVMIFIVTMPLWLAVIIWLFLLAAKAGQGKQMKMVHRTVTAPDGRVATFLVPAEESVSASIARMYPTESAAYANILAGREAHQDAEPARSVVPPRENDHLKSTVAPQVREPTISADASDLPGASQRRDLTPIRRAETPRDSHTRAGGKRAVITAGGVVLVLLVIGLSVGSYSTKPAVAPSSATSPPTPAALDAPPMAPPTRRVVLTTGANLRVAVGTASRVIRIVKKGDTFRAFDERSGWTQVGDGVAEGWIASSLLAPASQ